MLIRRWLDSTATQLTYPGLFSLSADLPPGSLSALFRNSHLSVLYRRPDDAESQQTSATLFTLVTDNGFVHEPSVVWESLEDVDGSESSFLDANLRKARFGLGGDWARSSAPRGTEQERMTTTTTTGDENEECILPRLLKKRKNPFC
jgi:hypothetical protein